MRLITPIVWLGSIFFSSMVVAGDFQPGQYDDFVLEHLKSIVQAVPLRTTTVRDVAPEFVVEKVEGLAWEEALAEADRRFGEHQPERALFLRKYLAKGAPESRLEDLHWPDRAPGFQSGPNVTVRLNWHGPAKPAAPAKAETTNSEGAAAPKQSAPAGRFARLFEKPIACIDTVVVDHHLTAVASLAFPDRKVKGMAFTILSFDEKDRLTWAYAEVAPDGGGPTIHLSCRASGRFGEGDTNSYDANMTDSAGNSEGLDYNADLVLQTRWVQRSPWKLSYHEVYEQGRLRKRLHEDWHQTPDGRHIRTEEQFP